jgi:predicted DNA-binding transcriptional regulator YafY
MTDPKEKKTRTISEKEYTGRTRSLRILRAIIESPFFYTREELARHYNVSKDAIKEDFEAFANAGFELARDQRHRYALALDRRFDNLKSLMVFSSKEEEWIMNGLKKLGVTDNDLEKLERKLNRIYDASKLPNTFDKNFLGKVDRLEGAIKNKKVVIFKDYRSSNSNTIKDRIVEVFHISAEDDTIHAYDCDEKEVKHYLISRVTKLEVTDKHWTHEGSHVIYKTDPFRIHNNSQVSIHLRMTIGGYNALIERYPVTRNYTHPSPDGGNFYDLECKVNNKYYGLTNFILGYYSQIVAIFEPDDLIEHIRTEANKLLEKKF